MVPIIHGLWVWSMRINAKPELLCSVEGCCGPPLPGGRVDLKIAASGYIDSGCASAILAYEGCLPIEVDAQHVDEELAGLHAVRGVVRAGVDAARFGEAVAEVARGCLAHL